MTAATACLSLACVDAELAQPAGSTLAALARALARCGGADDERTVLA